MSEASKYNVMVTAWTDRNGAYNESTGVFHECETLDEASEWLEYWYDMCQEFAEDPDTTFFVFGPAECGWFLRGAYDADIYGERAWISNA